MSRRLRQVEDSDSPAPRSRPARGRAVAVLVVVLALLWSVLAAVQAVQVVEYLAARMT